MCNTARDSKSSSVLHFTALGGRFSGVPRRMNSKSSEHLQGLYSLTLWLAEFVHSNIV